jgi:hypothetical protein
VCDLSKSAPTRKCIQYIEERSRSSALNKYSKRVLCVGVISFSFVCVCVCVCPSLCLALSLALSLSLSATHVQVQVSNDRLKTMVRGVTREGGGGEEYALNYNTYGLSVRNLRPYRDRGEDAVVCARARALSLSLSHPDRDGGEGGVVCVCV